MGDRHGMRGRTFGQRLRAATDTYEAFVKAGQGGLDFSAIVNYIRGDVEPSP